MANRYKKNQNINASMRFKRNLFLYSSIGIFLFSIILLSSVLRVVYTNFHQYEKTNFMDIAKIEKIAIEEWIRRIKDITWQITSRTKIREELKKYEQGEVSLKTLKSFTEPKLYDAARYSKNIMAIIRLDDKKKIVAVCGDSNTYLKKVKNIKSYALKDKIVLLPIRVNNKFVIAVLAPIIGRDKKYLGTDIAFFDVRNLKESIESNKYLNTTKDLVIGYLNPSGKVISIFSYPINYLKNTGQRKQSFALYEALKKAINNNLSGIFEWKNKIVAYTPIGEKSGWGLLVFDDKNKFYTPIYRHLTFIISIAIIIYAAFILGLWWITKPLTGKLLLQRQELEKIIEERTNKLREEINKRKKIEEKLEKSRAEYKKITQLKKAILESPSGIIVFALDREYKYLDFTLLHKETMREIWGVNIEIGKSMLSYIKNEEDRKKAKKNFDRALRGESFVLHEEYGDERLKRTFYEDRYSPIYDEDNKIIGVAVFVVDITELKRAEDALRQSKENLRITLNSIGDGVIAVDTNGRVTNMNPVAEKLTGWAEKEAIGKNIDDVFNIVNENTREKANNPVERVLKEGKIVGLANHSLLISRDGTEYNIADSAAPIVDERGNIHGVVLVFRDITENLKAERELSKLERLESIGLLAGGIAHDFNNILTGIFGNIELANIEIPENSPASEHLKLALQAMDKAMGLTKQLLTFAKGGKPVLERVNPKELIEETAKFILSGSNVKPSFNFQEELWPIRADRGQINQVITNLVVNAKEAMPNGGTLYITAKNFKGELEAIPEGEGKEDFVEITFRDEGVGIPREHLDKIFDPYFTTKEKGNGLGLSIVHSIVVKHGGYIKAESTPNKGTTFTLYLPRDVTLEKNIENKPIDPNRNKNKELTKKRILVLDDDYLVRKVAKRMIETLGYEIETAANSKEALKLYANAKEQKRPFDIVFTDLTIPGELGGKEVVQELLKIDPHAKVIVTSGYSTDSVMSNFTDYGFVGRVFKPFKLEDLKREILRVLSEQ